MRRTLSMAIVCVLLLTPLVALGAEVESTVKSVDTAGRLITLENGTIIAVPDGIAIDQLKEGADVRVSYEEKDGKIQATSVEMK